LQRAQREGLRSDLEFIPVFGIRDLKTARQNRRSFVHSTLASGIDAFHSHHLSHRRLDIGGADKKGATGLA
jgi:hypothetical protein